MNSNKYALRLTKLFNIIFGITFVGLLMCIIISGYEREGNRDTYSCSMLQHYAIIIAAVMLTTAFTTVYIFFFRNKTPNLINKNLLHNSNFIILISVFTMLVVQLVIGYLLLFDPVTDVGIINKYALDFAETGNFDLIQRKYSEGDCYLIRYPNNLAITFFLSFFYRISYLLTGNVSRLLPVVLNVIAINISVLMTVMLSRRLLGERKSLYVLLLCALFAPFYTYTAYFYTDSLSLPLSVGIVYFLSTSIRTERRRRRYILFALCGALMFLGFKMKGSLIIMLVGAVLYLFLKIDLKRALCAFLAIIIGFGSLYAICTTLYRSSGIITEEQAYECEYPATHWIMMSMKGYGNYNTEDSKYTMSFKNKDEKQAANIDEIKSRLKKMGVKGLITHTAKKAVWTWEDGTYFISHHIEKARNENVLHDFVLNKGIHHFIFYAYSCGFQLFILFMMIMSSVKAYKRKELNMLTLIRGLVFGLFVFLLIWETRSRYLYNFTPFFLILAADGMDWFSQKFTNISPKKPFRQ